MAPRSLPSVKGVVVRFSGADLECVGLLFGGLLGWATATAEGERQGQGRVKGTGQAKRQAGFIGREREVEVDAVAVTRRRGGDEVTEVRGRYCSYTAGTARGKTKFTGLVVSSSLAGANGGGVNSY